MTTDTATSFHAQLQNMPRKQRSRAGLRVQVPGFSLIELTLVVVILGVLMAVVAVNVLGQGEKAKIRATETSMTTIQSSLDSYHLEYSTYPPDLETLKTAKYLTPNKPIEDGWKRTYYYVLPGSTNPYDLMSAGSDGEFGTPDDINIWTMYDNKNKPSP